MIKEAVVKIVNKEDLTYEEAYTVMNEIMSGSTSPVLRGCSGTAHNFGHDGIRLLRGKGVFG